MTKSEFIRNQPLDWSAKKVVEAGAEAGITFNARLVYAVRGADRRSKDTYVPKNTILSVKIKEELAANPGLTSKAIAKICDCHEKTVLRVAVTIGHEWTKNRRRKYDYDQVRKLALSGLGVTEIAKVTEIPLPNAKYALRALRRDGLIPPAQPRRKAQETTQEEQT